MRDPHFSVQCHASVMEKLGRVSAKALGPIYESGTAAYLVLPWVLPTYVSSPLILVLNGRAQPGRTLPLLCQLVSAQECCPQHAPWASGGH